MKKKDKFSVSKRIRSFDYAFAGLKTLFIEEHNSWIHLGAAVVVVLLGVGLQISLLEWIALILIISLVLTMEIINTVIENIADFISPEKHMTIKKIKDLAAAGVLVSAISAVIIGLLVFLPKII